MTQEQFIRAIREEVMEAAALGVLQKLYHPPGRHPQENLLQLSSWFNRLSDSDKEAVADVARLVSHDAVFGFLCVLDGVRVIEDNSEKGVLSLVYRRGDMEIELNGPNKSLLHDLLVAE